MTHDRRAIRRQRKKDAGNSVGATTSHTKIDRHRLPSQPTAQGFLGRIQQRPANRSKLQKWHKGKITAAARPPRRRRCLLSTGRPRRRGAIHAAAPWRRLTQQTDRKFHDRPREWRDAGIGNYARGQRQYEKAVKGNHMIYDDTITGAPGANGTEDAQRNKSTPANITGRPSP